MHSPEKPPRYIPINEVSSNFADIHIPFPNTLDASRIGIDMEYLRSLCRLAGIQHITIKSLSDKENAAENISIVGINADGSAIGARDVSAVAAKTSHDIRSTGIWKPDLVARTDIEIHMDELINRVTQNYSEGVRSTNNWAKELDGILRKAIREEGIEFLMSKNWGNVGVEISFIVCMGMCINFMYYIDPSPSSLSLAMKLTLLCAFLGRTELARKTMLEAKQKNIDGTSDTSGMHRSPWFSIAGIEWDKAILLHLRTLGTRRLIAEIVPEIKP